MSSAKLTHIIYTSAATPGFNLSGLNDILKVSRSKNSRQSITGMLLYTAGSFFQILEGDESCLLELFPIIAADSRHTKVAKIIQEPISHRDFGDWTMGFTEMKWSDLASTEGLNDFFLQAQSLTELQPGRAKKLLTAFAQGRWRAALAGNNQ